jgi:hypothetical protein
MIKYYGVQFRNMHNAMNEVMIFKSKSEAMDSYEILREDAEEDVDIAFENAIANIEVDFRDITRDNKIKYATFSFIDEYNDVIHEEEDIKIVNANDVIDIYM